MKALSNVNIVIWISLYLSCSIQKQKSDPVQTIAIQEDSLLVAAKDSIQALSHIKLPKIMKDTFAPKSTYGSPDIINTEFPREWQISSIDPIQQTIEPIPSKLELIINDTSFLLAENKVRSREIMMPDSLSWEQQKAFVPYYDFLLGHAFGEPVLPISPLELLFSGTSKAGGNFAAYSTRYKAKDDSTPLGASGYKLIYLCTTDETNTVIDGFPIYYDAYFPYGGQQKQFFIDENGIIHLKYFRNDEEYRQFLRYERWTINSRGKLIRYYQKDGSFLGQTEEGLVVNHVRQGQWHEKNWNGFVNASTILEAQFQEGVPIGTWKYFETKSLSVQGKSSIREQERGDLLYTETYENGILRSRTFTQASNN